MTEQRKAFEKHIKSVQGYLELSRAGKDARCYGRVEGDYLENEAHLAWGAWQEAQHQMSNEYKLENPVDQSEAKAMLMKIINESKTNLPDSVARSLGGLFGGRNV